MKLISMFIVLRSVAREQRALRAHLQDPGEQPERGRLPAAERVGRPGRHLVLPRPTRQVCQVNAASVLTLDQRLGLIGVYLHAAT